MPFVPDTYTHLGEERRTRNGYFPAALVGNKTAQRTESSVTFGDGLCECCYGREYVHGYSISVTLREPMHSIVINSVMEAL